MVSLIPRPPPFFFCVLQFAFSKIHGNKQKKSGEKQGRPGNTYDRHGHTVDVGEGQCLATKSCAINLRVIFLSVKSKGPA